MVKGQSHVVIKCVGGAGTQAENIMQRFLYIALYTLQVFRVSIKIMCDETMSPPMAVGRVHIDGTAT